MNWPMPQDFNEAVQNPTSAFTDPDLKAGQAVVGPSGLPLPRSGNFADVYQIRAADGRSWAVKCFTRPVTGLEQRYAKVDDALRLAGLPFTIGFTFLNEGVRVRGKWLPAVKMEWVDGLLLNQVVRDQAGNPKVLDALCQMWARLCKRLRETGIAHADLQHGNVLLVPGTKPGSYGLKLIDYDGMYVPALANSPSGESGHPNYQHPARAAKQVYSPDLDRFPHLVIAAALKGLSVLGPSLWERYDSGDNLLFSEDDFRNPAGSKLMRELWETKNPGVQALVGHLAIACGKPVPQTPWLDQVAPDGVAVPLPPEQSRAVAAALDLAPLPTAVPVVAVVAPPAAAPALPVIPVTAAVTEAFTGFDVEPEPALRRKKPRPMVKVKKTFPILPIAIASGILLLVGGVVGAVVLLGGKKADETAQTEPEQKQDDDKGRSKQPPVKQTPSPNNGNPKPPDESPQPTVPGPSFPSNNPIIPPTPLPAGGAGAAALILDAADVPNLGLRWQATARGSFPQVRFTTDGQWLIEREPNITPIQVYSTRSGTKSAGFTEGNAPSVDFACLGDGRVASWHADQPWAVVWNPGTGKATGRIPVVPAPADRGTRVFDVSPDGRYAIVGYSPPNSPKDAGKTGRVIVYDSRPPGRTIATLDVRAPKFRFTPDDRLLIADIDRLRWLKLPDGQSDGELPVTGDPRGRVLACSKDGKLVLMPDRTREPKVLDTATGKVVANFPRRFLGLTGAISDDSRLVALCAFPEQNAPDRSSHLEVIDLTTGRLVGRFQLHPNSNIDVQSVAFAPDNSAVAIGRSGRRIQVIDLPKVVVAVGRQVNNPGPVIVFPKPGDPPLPPIGGTKPVWTAAVSANAGWCYATFSSDGETVVVGTSVSGAVRSFNARTGTPLPAAAATNRAQTALIPLDRGRVGVYHHSEYAVLVWDPKTGAMVGKVQLPGEKPSARPLVWLSPNERFLVVASKISFKPNQDDPKRGTFLPGEFRVYDTTTGKEVLKTDWFDESVHFTADSTRLLLSESNERFRWYKLPANPGSPALLQLTATLGNGRSTWGESRVLGISADGKLILYEGPSFVPPRKRTLILLDGTNGAVVRRLADSAGGPGALSADGRMAVRLVVGKQEEGATVEVIDVTTASMTARFQVSPEVKRPFYGFHLAPDGRSVVVYDLGAGRVAVYDLPNNLQVSDPKPKFPDPVVAPILKDPDPSIALKPKDSTPTTAKSRGRDPVPDEPTLTKAEAKLHALLKDDYAKKLPSEKRAFAQKLLGLAEATDPATRYVMLRDARDLATDVSDPPLMMLAVDGLLRWYDLDPDQVKLPALEQLKYKVGNTTALRAVVDLALVTGDTAAAADRHETAVKYAQLAVTAARRANIPAVIEETEAELTRVKKAADAFGPVKAAMDRIQANPDDRDAALTVGKYRCFTQGRWDEGVKFLAKGASGGLRTATELDAAAPGGGVPDLKVADAWWEFARSAQEPDKSAAESRARHWYARALPGLPADRRADVEARLALSVNGAEYRPGLHAEFTAKVPTILQGKKARIDPIVAFTGDEFKAEGIGKATDITVKWSGVIAPPRPGRYRLVAVGTDPVRVRLDGKVIIDTTGTKAARREAIVALPDRPTAITVEFTCLNTEKHNLKLYWVVPGGEAEELIPPEALLHDRKAEGALGKAP